MGTTLAPLGLTYHPEPCFFHLLTSTLPFPLSQTTGMRFLCPQLPYTWERAGNLELLSGDASREPRDTHVPIRYSLGLRSLVGGVHSSPWQPWRPKSQSGNRAAWADRKKTSTW
jgi:hypothetical protein